MSSSDSKRQPIILALSAGVLFVAVIVRLLTLSGADHTTLKKEDEWCAMLQSDEAGERREALKALMHWWSRQAESEHYEPVNEVPAKPDRNIQAILDVIQNESDEACRRAACNALLTAPPRRVQAAWVEDWLLEQAGRTADPLMKFYYGRMICRRYWRQGEAPSGRTMAMLDEALAQCHEPAVLEVLLRSIEELKSDLLPLETTIRRLTQNIDDGVSDRARRLMLAMKKPLNRAWRQYEPAAF